MNYKDTVQWMFSQLPMYQRQGKTAFKKDLKNIQALANLLDNPQDKFKSIHVAGTNGKGSVSHMLASILQEAGYTVGLYTSPHLKDFRERIKINGKEIRKNCVINFIKRHKDFFEQNKVSFFEMTVGLAFDYFAKKKVDIAIVEVGLGGRLDSTNLITPEVSVITNISLDHTQMLGNSIEKIAFEKAGIIKNNVPVVVGKTSNKAMKVFQQRSEETHSEIFFASNERSEYQSDLTGIYQKENILTAVTAIQVLQKKGFHITQNHIQKGLLKVKVNTGLHGRWDILQNEPLVIADTAHNEAGIKKVVEQIKTLKYNKLHFIISMVNDKDIDKILALLPKDATYYFTKANIPRGLDAYILQEKAEKFHLQGQVYPTINHAYQKALKTARKDDLIFVGGSTFTVAEVI